MTYKNFEASNHDAMAATLYKFAWGFSEWFYTSADRPVIVDGNEYLPIAISDNGFKQGGSQRADFTVNIEAAAPVVGLFRATPPSTPVILTVRRIHLDDPDAEAIILWAGRVGNVRRLDAASAAITCRNIGLRRAGLRLTWGRGCPHFLYGHGCRADKSLHAFEREIASVTGTTMTLEAAGGMPDDAAFNGGFVEWDADGLGTIERRAIERTTAADTFQIFGRTDGMSEGLAVTLYRGCNRTAEICDSVFDNLSNYGGIAQLAGKSPYDGTQVF